MWVQYWTFKNGQELHDVEIDVEEEEVDTTTLEGIQYINSKIAEAANIPVGSFKYRKI